MSCERQGEPRSVLKGSRAYDGAEVEFLPVGFARRLLPFRRPSGGVEALRQPGNGNGHSHPVGGLCYSVFKGAPLIMGRLSGRLIQSLFHPAGGQTQVYTDDVGPRDQGMQGAAQPPIGEGAVRAVGLRSPDIHGQR